MIRVDQTTFGHGIGNCFAACVASVMELPLAEAPNFCVDYDDETWWKAFTDWCRARGCDALYIEGGDHARRLARHIPHVPWIGSGPNPDGVAHSTVWVGEELVHDPNPGRRGIAELTSGIWIVAERPGGAR